jgi:hypothetical protein
MNRDGLDVARLMVVDEMLERRKRLADEMAS